MPDSPTRRAPLGVLFSFSFYAFYAMAVPSMAAPFLAAEFGLETIGHVGFFRPTAQPLWDDVIGWLAER